MELQQYVEQEYPDGSTMMHPIRVRVIARKGQPIVGSKHEAQASPPARSPRSPRRRKADPAV